MLKGKKKFASALATLLLSTALISGGSGKVSAEQQYPKVFLNGTEVQFDVQPQYINGRTYVPFRKLLEALGAKVDWDEPKQLATATKDGLTLTFITGSTTLTFENHNLSMDVPVVMIDYRNLVPLRFVAQALGAKVDWSRTSAGDEIQITQNYDEMIDRLVNGKNAAGDMKVTYDQAAILFEWLLNGYKAGKTPQFTGMEVPLGINWHYQYNFTSEEVKNIWEPLYSKYPDFAIVDTDFIKVSKYRIQKHEWRGGKKILFEGYSIWDTTRNANPILPAYEGVEMAHYLP